MSQSKRILIIGATGQVGTELKRSFADAGELVCPDRKGLDLTQAEQIRDFVQSAQPTIILNASAYTAVDRAETEPEIAMAINATAPRILAEEARRRDILLVHYSTDYVFDGSSQRPWVETDTPNPLNVYGASKLKGEQAIAEVGARHLTFRTSWVYGPHGKNFLLTMLRLGREREVLSIVDDQFGGPTTSIEIANATRSIVDGVLEGSFGAVEEWSGTYHMTCSGVTTWCGFTNEILAQVSPELGRQHPTVIGIRSEDYPTPARRPHYSVLSNEKLCSHFKIELPSWQSGLQGTLDRLDGRP